MYASPPALNLVVIRSSDVERAHEFYSAMGLLMSRDSHGSGPIHYVAVVCGLVFEIYPLSSGQPPTTGTRLGFQVDSVDELVPMLVEAGVR
jgi:catechol 2,3-dioxygenase-like lactoylglutathione lyase family enzyme